MKVRLAKANAFEVDPHKRYLVIVSTPNDMSRQEVEDASATMQQRFPNMTMVFVRPDSKFKVVEAPEEVEPL